MSDGTLSVSGGVDSARVTTVASPSNPDGLPRTMVSWLNNATVRGGTVSPRNIWTGAINKITGPGATDLFQGGYLYDPGPTANPYLIVSVGGHILQVLVEAPFTVTDLSVKFGLFNPPLVDQAFFEQAEQFLVIQAGDFLTNPTPTKPLFWDGTALRRSRGIISANNTPAGGITPYNELPAATCMCYYLDRLWYAQGRTYCAGDIVDGAAGTPGAPYFKSDSVLKVTENPLAVGGDNFTVPTVAGDIRALDYTANLNSQLGEGPLYVFTRKQIYQLVVPITRADWIAATSSNMPQQTVVQRRWGAVSDRSVVAVNGDLFYQSLEPAIRSLFVSLRDFAQWGNVPISRNEDRALRANDRGLMRFSTGINFDNRLLMGVLPVKTPVGVASTGLIPLDFDIISQFGSESVQETKHAPAWEGIWEGLKILQLFEGDFGGLQRAFGIIYAEDGSIQVWELTNYLLFENGDNRVTYVVETPAYTWNKEFDLKQLDGGEFWFDQVFGTVDVLFEWRVDANPCPNFWKQERFCVTRNSCEDVKDPVCYPIQEYCEGYKFPIVLPAPDGNNCASMNLRPVNIGYQHQLKITVTGQARLRGYILYAIPVMKRPGDGLNC
jgi:hypothetical protein